MLLHTTNWKRHLMMKLSSEVINWVRSTIIFFISFYTTGLIWDQSSHTLLALRKNAGSHIKFFFCVKVINIEMLRLTHNWQNKDTHSHLLPEAAERKNERRFIFASFELECNFAGNEECGFWSLVTMWGFFLTVIMARWNDFCTWKLFCCLWVLYLWTC